MSNKDFWASVPSVDDPVPAQPAGSAPVLQAKLHSNRRTLFKAAGALGGAFALNVISWLPQAGSKPAQAARGTEYSNCTIYASEPDYTRQCWGAPWSRNYCGSDGWFLKMTSTTLISGPTTACNGRNAWRWTYSGTPYRCADGMQEPRGGSRQFLICSWSNP